MEVSQNPIFGESRLLKEVSFLAGVQEVLFQLLISHTRNHGIAIQIYGKRSTSNASTHPCSPPFNMLQSQSTKKSPHNPNFHIVFTVNYNSKRSIPNITCLRCFVQNN